MTKFGIITTVLALFAAPAHADIVWTGAVSGDIFDEANWDLSGSTVTVIDPNVSIDDNILIVNAAATVEIPNTGGGQVRFQIGNGYTLTIDASVVSSLQNDGVGGASGASPGPNVLVTNGGSFNPYFISNHTALDISSGCSATFSGGANPINGSAVNLTAGAILAFLDETPTDYINQHLNKTTVDGAPAVVDGNISVVSDGASGCIVSVISPVTSYCTGDQGTCPCGNENDGSNGSAGCANGAGPGGGALSVSGSTSIAAGDLALAIQGALPSQPCLFFQGNNAVNGGNGVTFGDGLRCAGGAVVRLQVRFADGSGDAQTTLDIPAAGGCMVGDTKRYQGWYRDPNFSLCGTSFNLSNGVELDWGP